LGESLAPATLVIRAKLRADVEDEFSAWHARLFSAAAEKPGLVSAELNAPEPAHPYWSVIQHFRAASDLAAWRSCASHDRLLEELRGLLESSDSQPTIEEELANRPGVVTEVITTFVKAGKDHEYRQWAQRIHRAEALFPGYRGVYLQPPTSAQQRYWTTLVRFARPEQLDAWLNSDERRDLLQEHAGLVQSWEHHRLPTSFAGWFPADAASGNSPPSWKQSMLVILMLFPIVAVERRFLTPILHGLNFSGAMFIGNVLSVVALAVIFMPLAIAAMKWWLLPRSGAGGWINPVGVAILLGLYAIEITAVAELL
jgi:uncharacterized protein